MRWLLSLFGREPEPTTEDPPQRYHCIRFITDRGEQVGVLLTDEEFERGITRWVDTVDEMPIEATDPDGDERVI